jgi:hypothetical protein
MKTPSTLTCCLLVTGIVAAGLFTHASSAASEAKPAEQETPAVPAPASPPASASAVAPATAPVVRIPPGTPPSPECAWTGQRIVLALLRDDVLAADGFLGFYSRFGCPDGHLGRAFGCAVPLVNADSAPRRQHIAACWLDPDSVVTPDTTARTEKKDARADGATTKEPEKSGKPGTPR